jgi:hypothetical protein
LNFQRDLALPACQNDERGVKPFLAFLAFFLGLGLPTVVGLLSGHGEIACYSNITDRDC